jgi:hypothetical protein
MHPFLPRNTALAPNKWSEVRTSGREANLTSDVKVRSAAFRQTRKGTAPEYVLRLLHLEIAVVVEERDGRSP